VTDYVYTFPELRPPVLDERRWNHSEQRALPPTDLPAGFYTFCATCGVTPASQRCGNCPLAERDRAERRARDQHLTALYQQATTRRRRWRRKKTT
jgi:hypothetical protein